MTISYNAGLPLDAAGRAVRIAAPSEVSASLTVAQIDDLTTTRQRVAFPSGAKTVFVSYRLLPGATAVTSQYARIVFNAETTAIADGLLTVAGAYVPIFQGEDLAFAFTEENLCVSVDVIASLAVASEKTVMRIVGGV